MGQLIRAITGAVSRLTGTRTTAPVAAPSPDALGDAILERLDRERAVEDAARAYARATNQARTADRAKRAAKKILDATPAGRYGRWLITREPSNRQTADLDAIRAIFDAHGLGPIPMKPSAPSLKVERIEQADSVRIAA